MSRPTTGRPGGAAVESPPTAVRLPNRASAGSTLFALVGRDLAERGRLVPPLLLDLAFGIVNLAVFLLISRVLSAPDDDALRHFANYFDFVAVGLTFMLVVQAATSQVTSRVAQEQRDGTLEMLVAQPVPRWVLAVGLAAHPFAFALLRATIYLAVLSLLFGLDVSRASWVGTVLVLAAAVGVMLAVGVALMAFTVAFGRGDLVARLTMVVIAFVSGTYFPVATLPGVPSWLTAALPTRIALDGFRHALNGQPWGSDLIVLLGCAAIMLPISVGLFGGALHRACRRGTLNRE
ncbi:ABC transporter permease [Micromonospora sp. C51]|uniref:ABC transporter permease n=1 Tax=Micromonospora sp. C51 TaxID=2824879 RepID=UPI001B36FF21|nr:ABC transporter permease [Micromonospora sp. C51]MBQ1049531.1 ABC transporter permease [Micromonospora sp. C51]